MGLRYFDSHGEYTEPIATTRLYFDANHQWTRPGGGSLGLKYYDANGNWTVPEMGTPIGDIPIGGTINYLTLFGAPIEWIVIGRDLPGMPEDSITLFMKSIVALRSFDASEPMTPAFGSTGGRQGSGNNDWGVSNLRQWANSAAPAGEWYSPQHEYDAPPDTAEHCRNGRPYESDSGMLYESTQKERDLAIATTRNYAGYPGNTTTCVDKFFPLTSNEIGYESISGNGTKIPYFTDAESRIAHRTEQCIAEYKTWTSAPQYLEAEWHYWLQNGHPSNPCVARMSEYHGLSLDGQEAWSSDYGVRLACNLPANERIPLTKRRHPSQA